jgi:anti-anti-sigma regulatory factor
VLALRTFRLADGGWAVAVRGDLDGRAALAIADEVRECTGGLVVVDLRHARFVDQDALEALAATVQATFVVERPLRDVLQHRPITVAADLRAAFAL